MNRKITLYETETSESGLTDQELQMRIYQIQQAAEIKKNKK